MRPQDAHRKSLLKLLQDTSRQEGWMEHEALSRFLEAAYRAIRGSVLSGEAWDKNEAAYMKIVERCRHPKDTMRRFSEMLGVTTMALEAECRDFLGPTFMEISGSAHLGQFFTPHEVSKMMALMTMGDIGAVIAQSGRSYFTAQEPAAGMGGMVLAVAEVMREQGFDPARHCHWQMIDVEFNAMCGCYVQTALAGVSGVVIHGNTLTLQEWTASATPTAVLFPKRFGQGVGPEVPGDEVATVLPDPKPATPPCGGGAQLAFDFQL